MESLEEVIRSEDPKLIKTRRDAIQEGMTSIEKSMRRLLARSAGKIQRLQVQIEHESIKKYQEDFKILVEAYFMYGMDINDIEEETSVFQEQEEIYNDVQDGFYETLQLYVDYEESYKIYKAALPDPDLAKNDAEEASMKESFTGQMK